MPGSRRRSSRARPDQIKKAVDLQDLRGRFVVAEDPTAAYLGLTDSIWWSAPTAARGVPVLI
jgi:hypothetical protein